MRRSGHRCVPCACAPRKSVWQAACTSRHKVNVFDAVVVLTSCALGPTAAAAPLRAAERTRASAALRSPQMSASRTAYEKTVPSLMAVRSSEGHLSSTCEYLFVHGNQQNDGEVVIIAMAAVTHHDQEKNHGHHDHDHRDHRLCRNRASVQTATTATTTTHASRALPTAVARVSPDSTRAQNA
jgi:hypothetical protein